MTSARAFVLILIIACEEPEPRSPDLCAELASGGDGFISVSAAYNTTMALRADGTAICWGGEYVGGICLAGTQGPQSFQTPVESLGLSCVTHLELEYTSGVALTARHEGLIWSSNPGGELGPTEPWQAAAEGPIRHVSQLGELRAIKPAGYGVAAQDEDGALWWWGHLWRRQETPERIDGVGNVVSFGVSPGHICAVNDLAEVWCLGDNVFGELGDGTRVAKDIAVRVQGLPAVASVALEGSQSCALTQAGEVWCWGGDFGSLGQGRSPTSGEPTEIVLQPAPAIGLPPSRKVLMAGFSGCAITDDDDLYCWGRDWGRFTSNDNYNLPYPTLVAAPGKVVDIALGSSHACAVTIDGTVWCAGHPFYLGRPWESMEATYWAPIAWP